MFSYYDNRLKSRLNNINSCTEENNLISVEIKELTNTVLKYMEWDEQNRGGNQDGSSMKVHAFDDNNLNK